MPYHRSDDLWPPLALLVLGLLVPGLLWAIAGEFIGLYLSPIELTLVSIVGYGLLAWFLIDRGTLDRTSYVLVSLIWPWPLLFCVLLLLLLLHRGEQIPRGPLANIFRTVTTDWPGSLIGYGALYTATGIVVFLISRRYDDWLRSGDRLPSPSRLIPALVAVVILIALVTIGVNTVTSQSTSIDHLGPGTKGYHDPTFNVTVGGPTQELRLSVTAPNGTTVTKRVSRSKMQGGSGTISVPLDYDDSGTPGELPVQDGTYHVQVTSLAGIVVDTATFEAEDAVSGSLSVVQNANDTGSWPDDPFVYTERNASDDSLAFWIANEGAFHAEMTVLLRIPADPIIFDHIPMPPGERHGVVFRLAPDTRNSVRAKTNGTVTAELYPSAHGENPIATTRVRVPSND